ncbi:hypothetical protein OOK39_43840 [Streptomyces sp. NBC_00264]|uniref:hypothetical protein n=1 Tax=unclassified Streptomyces TaxID=2593676 RepID=UPI0022583645|nr:MULTISPECIES: hypothetical protein [unclassified Streptomyces]MCX5166041.1 hypothetical protein [Streptomyces sp. NBC_00305]MCX5224514.1 hypothetical protein [Streptomyces sp. NBC_00264]
MDVRLEVSACAGGIPGPVGAKDRLGRDDAGNQVCDAECLALQSVADERQAGERVSRGIQTCARKGPRIVQLQEIGIADRDTLRALVTDGLCPSLFVPVYPEGARLFRRRRIIRSNMPGKFANFLRNLQ